MNDIIITHGITFNINDVLYILRGRIGLKSHGLFKELTFENGVYEEITEKIVEYQNHKQRFEECKQRFEECKKRLEDLQLHVALMPGGSEYLLTKMNFENQQKQCDSAAKPTVTLSDPGSDPVVTQSVKTM